MASSAGCSAPLLSLFVGQRLRGLTATVKQENLRTLTELIDAGKVTPIIDRTYPLAEAADAVRYLAEGHPPRQGRHRRLGNHHVNRPA